VESVGSIYRVFGWMMQSSQQVSEFSGIHKGEEMNSGLEAKWEELEANKKGARSRG